MRAKLAAPSRWTLPAMLRRAATVEQCSRASQSSSLLATQSACGQASTTWPPRLPRPAAFSSLSPRSACSVVPDRRASLPAGQNSPRWLEVWLPCPHFGHRRTCRRVRRHRQPRRHRRQVHRRRLDPRTPHPFRRHRHRRLRHLRLRRRRRRCRLPTHLCGRLPCRHRRRRIHRSCPTLGPRLTWPN